LVSSRLANTGVSLTAYDRQILQTASLVSPKVLFKISDKTYQSNAEVAVVDETYQIEVSDRIC
jgi:hypothetical protein